MKINLLPTAKDYAVFFLGMSIILSHDPHWVIRSLGVAFLYIGVHLIWNRSSP